MSKTFLNFPQVFEKNTWDSDPVFKITDPDPGGQL
jgi:hypothetical protein